MWWKVGEFVVKIRKTGEVRLEAFKFERGFELKENENVCMVLIGLLVCLSFIDSWQWTLWPVFVKDFRRFSITFIRGFCRVAVLLVFLCVSKLEIKNY